MTAPNAANDLAALIPDDDELHIRTWDTSEERRQYIRRQSQVYATAIGGFLTVIGGALLYTALQHADGYHISSVPNLWRVGAICLMVLGLIVLAYSSMPYFSLRLAFRQRVQALSAARLDYAINQATLGTNPSSLMQLPQLFALNRRQLDQYLVLTRRQQKSAFRVAQVMAALGFVVLIGGTVLAFTAAHGDAQKYVSGGLGVVGSALSAFLASTFYSASKDADELMNRYYMEPQRTGRLLAAENLVLGMDSKADAQRAIIDALLKWELPLPGGTPAAGTPPDEAKPADSGE